MLTALYLAFVVHGDSLARDVVAKSAAAMGGFDRLRAMPAIRVEEAGHEYLISTPELPNSPRRFATQSLVTLRRYGPGATGLREHVTQTFPMRPGPIVQTVIASDTVAATPYDAAVAEELVDLAPDRVLLTASNAPDLASRPDTVAQGIRYRVVRFHWRDATIDLAINAATWIPERLVLVRSYPMLVFWAMWGAIRFETVWSSWAIAPNGLWYPHQRTTFFNGERFREYVVTAIDPSPAAPPDSFVVDSVRHARPDVPLSPDSLGDGIVLFKGGYQSTLVRQDDGLVVIEAPESPAKSRAVIEQAARLFPNVPIRAVDPTSPMWMHVGGLGEYAARGIPIYVLDANERPVRAFLKGSPTLRVVRGPTPVGRGSNRLTLIPVRGSHAAAMMLVYWPERHLLYASDMVIPPTFEPIFTSAYEARLRQTIERLGLAPTTVYSLHLPAQRVSQSTDR